MRMLDDEESNDVEVSWADQQKINQFSRLNNRQTEALAELEAIRTEKEQVDEVFEEVQLLEMSEGFEDDLGTSDDEDAEKEKSTKTTGGVKSNLIPFKIGDAFAHVTFEKATELLEKEQKRLQAEIERLETQSQLGEDEMKKLKVDLYAKFGSNINLERD
ncbi:putative GIM3-Gim complex component [Meira miltonrushii]|uniref:Putative GIM3-Gim complex component n=1 Tax=Meira miltonrushii TaxID=1280837 RepID=A0A316V6I7_9BASI|nr:putative GIM3-Gim complex component [Meira miltonrushii]PWN32638.1 putative GIM3-Gim complex component [Meira miltonrushii]